MGSPLLHIDAFELPKFNCPGHWAHGDRSERHRTRKAGKVKVIGVIDDHTRLAYCELHAKENAAAVSATLQRAATWFREQGCGPVQAVMSDNAKCYATSHQFRHTLNELDARHILIPPYTPRWNGKIERFFGTLDTEWAHARIWPDSTTRDRVLQSSSGSTTASDHTQPPAAAHPSPAFTKSVSTTPSARRDLKRLDLQVARHVLTAIDRLLDQDPSLDVRWLAGTSESRIRVGDWRIRFDRDTAAHETIILRSCHGAAPTSADAGGQPEGNRPRRTPTILNKLSSREPRFRRGLTNWMRPSAASPIPRRPADSRWIPKAG